MGNEDVRRYARALAQLADPFAQRREVLAALGLDEDGWRRLDASWRASLKGQSSGSAMLAAFREAFSRERERLRSLRRPAEPSPTPSAPSSGDAGDIDTTGFANAVLVPALPFRASSDSAPPPAAAGQAARPDDVNQTALVEEVPFRLVLPFEEPSR